MRNAYSFNGLLKYSLPTREDEADVFLKMSNVIYSGEIRASFENLNKLQEWLLLDEYYIAHNLTARKGMAKIFMGRVFISKRDDLVSFLSESMRLADVRCFLISPVSSGALESVIYMDDEQIHLYQA